MTCSFKIFINIRTAETDLPADANRRDLAPALEAVHIIRLDAESAGDFRHCEQIVVFLRIELCKCFGKSSEEIGEFGADFLRHAVAISSRTEKPSLPN